MIMLSYEDIRKKVITEPCNNLLLGSGFSRAFSENLNLDEKKYLNQELTDREKYERNIQRNDSIKKEMNPNAFIVGNSIQINKRRTIVEDLSLYHPKGICEIKQQEAMNCFDFLSPYLKTGKVFTLNYDLMLYWASVKAVEAASGLYKDGFDVLNSTRNGWVWSDDESVNVYYCHGALNLYSSNTRCYKSSHDQLCFLPLRQSIDNKHLPLYVSELTSEKKAEVIHKNDYLSSCLRAIKAAKGTMVIIGFAANENDRHIMEAIKHAQEQFNLKVYFGLYVRGKDWKDVRERVKSSGIEVSFFDSSTANIWRKETVKAQRVE